MTYVDRTSPMGHQPQVELDRTSRASSSLVVMSDVVRRLTRRRRAHPSRQIRLAVSVERHRSGRLGWLRAAVLGADDGIVSTASLLVGISSASGSRSTLVTTGIAALVAGAMSMAAGEWVSVSSQRDGERADLDVEREELTADPNAELAELTSIYVRRGVPEALARQVAEALSTNDVVDAHARDELGLDLTALARPGQAATASATAFALGALIPTITVAFAPVALRTMGLATTALVALGALGTVGAGIGGGSRWRGALRVAAGGGLAMLITGLVGRAVHATGI